MPNTSPRNRVPKVSTANSRVIRIDADVWQYIKDRGEPLAESPNDALRRIFGLPSDKPITPERSYQARLARLGGLLQDGGGRITNGVREELKAIYSAFKSGVFN